MTNDYLLCGTDNSAVGIWSLETGDIVLKLEGHRQGITDVRAVSDDLVVSASYDFTVRMWSIGPSSESGLCLAILKGHRDFVRSLAVRYVLQAHFRNKYLKLSLNFKISFVFVNKFSPPELITYFISKLSFSQENQTSYSTL